MTETTTCQCGCGTAVDTATGTCQCGCGTAAETTSPKVDTVPTGACGCGTENAGARSERAEACTCGCCDPVPA